jgi:D-3-phosphoglycerate dehydrogenase
VVPLNKVSTVLIALPSVEMATWPNRVEEADFIVVNCALTPSSHHMLNADVLARAKPGVRVVNVGRGPVVDEAALAAALQSGQVFSAALDVFEEEPMPADSPLRQHARCVFGSHNASNTADAVVRTSHIAIARLMEFLGAKAA